MSTHDEPEDYAEAATYRLDQVMPATSATLATWRDAAGLTQREAAERFGVTRQSLISWERPENPNMIYEDVLEKLDAITEPYLVLCESIDETIEMQAALGLTQEIVLCRYRDDAALHAELPTFPGGAASYNRLLAAVFLRYYLDGYRVSVLWDDDPTYALKRDELHEHLAAWKPPAE